MRSVLQKVASVGAALVVLASPAAAQTVETYETVPACNNARPNMGVFSGINYLSQWTCYNFAQSPFNPSSGSARLYAVSGNANAASASFQFLSPKQFLGAWFSGNAGSVQFDMSYLGSSVWTSALLGPQSTPMFLASGYSGAVDQVTVNGSNVQWVMDDVTYDNVVPEPTSLALVGAGLLALGFVARRRRA